jgi:hypothetical protein
MAEAAAERGHYSYSRLDAVWTRAAIDMLCNDHEELTKLKDLIAELLDDPLVLDGAPPGLGWFERAEVALGRPIGSSFQNALSRKRRPTFQDYSDQDDPKTNPFPV